MTVFGCGKEDDEDVGVGIDLDRDDRGEMDGVGTTV